MFYAMQFVPVSGNFFGYFIVRAVRAKPYKTLEAAKKAVEKRGKGYVKKSGVSAPIWSNVTQ